MISKSKARLIKSLQVKKYRLAEQCFLVHGEKALKETLASDFEVITLLGTEEFLSGLTSSLQKKASEIIACDARELASVSAVESNDAGLAVVRMKSFPVPDKPTGVTLVLDDIRDPGNLGTIIRIADWYKVRQIIASSETADHYNPKSINASMGSFLRVAVSYTDLKTFLRTWKGPVWGTFLGGADVHEFKFAKDGLLVIGNESRGISDEVAAFVTDRVTIPRFGQAESLNASTATAVVLDNIRRLQA